MSSTIAIPTTRSTTAYQQSSPKQAHSSSSSYLSSPHTPATSHASTPSSRKSMGSHQRRPSLMSSAFSKDESTVINIGDPNGPVRLISYLASSQGFAWNPEIFLPSYMDCEYTPLEARREPVHEIVVSDEEMKELPLQLLLSSASGRFVSKIRQASRYQER